MAPGIHRLPGESACGKSAISKIFASGNGINGDIVTFKTAESYKSLDYTLGGPADKLYFLDHFDRFENRALWDVVNKHSNKCIIIDCKGLWCTHDYPMRTLWSFTEKGIRMRDDVTAEVDGVVCHTMEDVRCV